MSRTAPMIGSNRSRGTTGEPQACHQHCYWQHRTPTGRLAAKKTAKARERQDVRRHIAQATEQDQQVEK